MKPTLEDIFAVLEDGVPDEEPTPEEVAAARSLVCPPLVIPENALLFLSPCFCLKAEVAAEGGCISHAFLHHVRFIIFDPD